VTVQANEGLIVEQNALQAGRGPPAWHAAIQVPHAPLPMLLLNRSGRALQIEGNEVGAGGTVETTSSARLHRLRKGARDLYGAYKVANAVKCRAVGWLCRP
jgi:hypothetical protein